MTKLEVMKYNNRMYMKVLKRIPEMSGLEKAVAQYITLPWLKGHKWMGGLSDSAADKAYARVLKELGDVTWDDVYLEAHKQQNWCL